jgi:hypothetical protein
MISIQFYPVILSKKISLHRLKIFGLDHTFGHHINVIPAKAGIQALPSGFPPSRE